MKNIADDNVYFIGDIFKYSSDLTDYLAVLMTIKPKYSKKQNFQKFIRPVYIPRNLPEHYHSCALLGWKKVDNTEKLHYIIVQPDYLDCDDKRFDKLMVMCTVGPVHDTDEWSIDGQTMCRNKANETDLLNVLVCVNFESKGVLQDFIGVSLIKTDKVEPVCTNNSLQKDYIIFLPNIFSALVGIPEEYHYLAVHSFKDMFLPKGMSLLIIIPIFLALIIIYVSLEYFII